MDLGLNQIDPDSPTHNISNDGAMATLGPKEESPLRKYRYHSYKTLISKVRNFELFILKTPKDRT